MEKDYRDYIQDILDSIDEIYVFIGKMSREEFLNDRKTVKAVLEKPGDRGRSGQENSASPQR